MHDKYLIADDLAYLLGGRNTDNRFWAATLTTTTWTATFWSMRQSPDRGSPHRQLRDYFHPDLVSPLLQGPGPARRGRRPVPLL